MFSVAIELGARRLQHYRPLAVQPGLRGYTGEGSQLRIAEVGSAKSASITALAARFCPTGRDLFLEKRCRVDTPSWQRSVLGKVVDRLLVDLHREGLNVLEDAFESNARGGGRIDLDALVQMISERGEYLAGAVLEQWEKDGLNAEEFARRVGEPAEIIDRTQSALVDLARSEARILGRYIRNRRRVAWVFGQDWMAEVRATIARLQTGIHLDGRRARAESFGMSQGVTPDFVYAVTLVGDVKTGQYHDFYDTVATGYAIFAEHALQRRINTAAILSVDLDIAEGRLGASQVHLVTPDDQKRLLWLAQRDSALSILSGGAAPAHPTDTTSCGGCPYRNHCWQHGQVDGTATTPAVR